MSLRKRVKTTSPPGSRSSSPATRHPALRSKDVPVMDRLAAAWNSLNKMPDATHYAVLMVLSFVTRMLFLGYPKDVVFDEYHFGRFTNNYLTSNYLFDIHPPLGKLTMAAYAYLIGYDPSVCQYDNIGDTFDDSCKFAELRLIVAFFGFFLPMQTFAIIRLLGASSTAALLGGLLVVFDSLHVIESRLILTDSQLMFYKALALWVALKFWKRLDATRDGKTMSNRERNAWLVGLGLACGGAVSVKWTTLATPGMIAIESTFGLFGFVKKTFPLLDLLKVAVTVIMLYSLCFQFHFSYLTKSGDGDAFMPFEFQQTLEGNPHYDPNAQPLNFWYIMPELNREMLSANARIDTPHDWSSRWYEWLYNAKGVLYWSQPADDDKRMIIYLLGNPIVVWLTLATVLSTTAVLLLAVRYRLTSSPSPFSSSSSTSSSKSKSKSSKKAADTSSLSLQDVFTSPEANRVTKIMGYLFCTYWFNLLPYIAVSRAAFIYHYMPGQFYAIILTAVALDWAAGSRIQQVLYYISIPVVLTFLYYLPWTYGLPLSAEGHEARRWLSTWT